MTWELYIFTWIITWSNVYLRNILNYFIFNCNSLIKQCIFFIIVNIEHCCGLEIGILRKSVVFVSTNKMLLSLALATLFHTIQDVCAFYLGTWEGKNTTTKSILFYEWYVLYNLKSQERWSVWKTASNKLRTQGHLLQDPGLRVWWPHWGKYIITKWKVVHL